MLTIWMGGYRVDAASDGGAQNVVQVSLAYQRMGVGVIGNEIGEAGINVVFRDGVGQLRQVVPGRTEAQLSVLAQAHLRQRVLAACGFVAAAHARSHVGVQPLIGFGIE